MEAPGASRGGFSLWAAPAVALAIGLPILASGLVAQSAPQLLWFIPLCDGLAIGCMLVTFTLGVLDAALRGDRRSLPIAAIAVATAIMWAGHFIIFPGDVPGLGGSTLNQATANLFLGINLLTPIMLSIALLQGGSPLSHVTRAVILTTLAGALIGGAAVALALAIGTSLQSVSSNGTFFDADRVVGVAGLVPALLGIFVFLAGRRGDVRIAGGVLAALTFMVLNSVTLLLLVGRYTPMWYADHVLALLAFLALLAGQLMLYAGSVGAERRSAGAAASAAERRRIGLEIAHAMAVQVEVDPVVERLLAGAIEAVDADRGTMLRLVPGGFVVEHSIDKEGRSAQIGRIFSLDSVVAGASKVVELAVSTKRAQLAGPYRVISLDTEIEDHADIRHSMVMPLMRGGEVDAVMILGRRHRDAFTDADVDQLRDLGAIAALLIRNARLLTAAESASIAKSNFMNLAAHELRTPLSVINGYVNLLADGSFGAVSEPQQKTLDVVRNKARELNEQVEHLLIAARLESAMEDGDPAGTPSVVDLRDIVREAVDRHAGRASLVGATVVVDLPSSPVRASADVRNVAIIIDNLLNNAMTYSNPPSEVRVQVAAEDRPLVRVMDRGIGIAADQHERIFEQFYRVDNTLFGYPSGTGLGLFISRRLAARSGGELVLERSAPGEGSTFTLRLAAPADGAQRQA
ncbi:MAG TPA: GAF domain-containing sensor histidine kinase [Candidatus Dormibacteraeota bacterium]